MATGTSHTIRAVAGIRYRPAWLVWVVFGFAGLALLQDAVYSWVHGTPFYWSEALLFKVFWFLFLPLGYAFLLFDRRYPGPTGWGAVVARVFLASMAMGTAHVLLFATVISGVSELFFAESFSFYWAIEKNFSVHFYKYLSAYLGISAAVVWFHRHPPGASAPKAELQEAYPGVLTLQNGKKRIPVPVADIVSVHADDPYVAVHANGNVYLQASSLRRMEESLDPSIFVRVHRSSIANIRRVVEMRSRMNGDYDLRMCDGREIRLSRRYAQALKEKLPTLAEHHAN